ncbi:site-specific integrase [Chengkuizengella sediminis]|uniref:site-specific integrase n=1 Tax=Chengkuizengella sediminis TaxID=1885917 RepID=UPI001F0FE05E|nr:site-specific integrase [Chengkuizengella sediminis]
MFEKLEQEPLKWKVFVELATTTGMRRGEILALDINKHIHIDKDEKSAHIEVNESLTYVDGKPLFKSPKTKKSQRKIALTPELIPLIKKLSTEVKKLKFKLGNKWIGGNRMLLFCRDNGFPMYHTSPTQWFNRFLKRHGLNNKRISIHSLRHSSATYLLARGKSLKEIQERLGHADIRTRANLYTHFVEELDKEAAQAFSKLKRIQK